MLPDFQEAFIALPLLGERAGVRADNLRETRLPSIHSPSNELAAAPKQPARQRPHHRVRRRAGLRRRAHAGQCSDAMEKSAAARRRHRPRPSAVPCHELLARTARQQWRVARLAAAEPLFARRHRLAAHAADLAAHHAAHPRRVEPARSAAARSRLHDSWLAVDSRPALADGARRGGAGGGADLRPRAEQFRRARDSPGARVPGRAMARLHRASR